MKLRKLLNYAEPCGDFLACIPGSGKQSSYLSTVAYIAQLVIHRYAMLGILTEAGSPMKTMEVVTDEPTIQRRRCRPWRASCVGNAGMRR